MNSQQYIEEIIEELNPAYPLLLTMQLEKLVEIAQKEGFEQAFNKLKS